jgi:hypothetical protein
MSKNIHIVFQVLNFLYSIESKKFNLLPNDERILINLAHHNGPKGIFPSVKTIAKELNITDRYVRERLSFMAGKKVILIDKNDGKRNSYLLHFLLSINETEFYNNLSDSCPTTEPQFTPELQFTPEPQFHIPLNPSSATPEPQFRHITTKDQPINNKDKRKEHLQKRDASKTAISKNFTPNENHAKLANQFDLKLERERDSFIDYYKAHGKRMINWNSAFNNWLRKSSEFKGKSMQKEHHVTSSIRQLKEKSSDFRSFLLS